MAKGYWVACVNINNQAEYKKYLDLAGPAVYLYGGKILLRGGKVENIEGNKYKRIVIIVFDSSDKAKECYKSKEYQQAFSFLKDDVAERIIHTVERLN